VRSSEDEREDDRRRTSLDLPHEPPNVLDIGEPLALALALAVVARARARHDERLGQVLADARDGEAHELARQVGDAAEVVVDRDVEVGLGRGRRRGRRGRGRCWGGVGRGGRVGGGGGGRVGGRGGREERGLRLLESGEGVVLEVVVEGEALELRA